MLNFTKEQAIEYSEGNKVLEKCLLKMWDNKIYTIGCCIGHIEKSISYIGIDLINSDINLVINLLNNLNKDKIKIGYTSNIDKKSCSIKSFDINDEALFNEIIELLDKNKESTKKDYFDTINMLNIDSGYITYQYEYKNNKLDKFYCITDNNNIINEYKKMYKNLNKKNNLMLFDLIK